MFSLPVAKKINAALTMFLLIALLSSSCSQVDPVKKISVFDSESREKILSSKEDLSRFERLWIAKTEGTPPANLKWLYKIDVTTELKANRWLYDRAGWLRVLSMKRTPTYKISSPEEFNRLLEIE